MIVYLTSVANYVRVIARRPNAAGVFSLTRCALPRQRRTKWDTSERMVLGVIMSTVPRLHGEMTLLHCEANWPVYRLWTKIASMHQSLDAPLRRQA